MPWRLMIPVASPDQGHHPEEDLMYKAMLLSTAMLSVLPVAASATLLTRSVDNAVRACSTAIKKETDAEVREIYHERIDGSHFVYANLRENRNGEARPLRATCQAQALGQRVVQIELAANSVWVPDNGD